MKLPLTILDSLKSKIENAVPLELCQDRFFVDAGPKCRLLQYGTPGMQIGLADESLPLILVSTRSPEQ
jgi:hypothetical protein